MVLVMIEEVCNDLAYFAVDVGVMFVHMRGTADWAWYDASHLHGAAENSIAREEGQDVH